MTDNKMEMIEDYLLGLGVKVHYSGFWYLAKAIDLYAPGVMVTKELYPDVAKEFSTTPSRIERGIRHAVRSVEDHMTNHEFIARAHLLLSRKRRSA
ncbi:MAG: sporulation initiation factor Spo0A C-terminal domain-containing protein [Peptococcaceae bacterium]|nr:sporulation initiation factor Spo0A C-terminal domain-containing protein [Peptococcaceae bacterium]